MIAIADHLLDWPTRYLEGRDSILELIRLPVVMRHWTDVRCDVHAPPVCCQSINSV